jgi:hypothetical protein
MTMTRRDEIVSRALQWLLEVQGGTTSLQWIDELRKLDATAPKVETLSDAQEYAMGEINRLRGWLVEIKGCSIKGGWIEECAQSALRGDKAP